MAILCCPLLGCRIVIPSARAQVGCANGYPARPCLCETRAPWHSYWAVRRACRRHQHHAPSPQAIPPAPTPIVTLISVIVIIVLTLIMVAIVVVIVVVIITIVIVIITIIIADILIRIIRIISVLLPLGKPLG